MRAIHGGGGGRADNNPKLFLRRRRRRRARRDFARDRQAYKFRAQECLTRQQPVLFFESFGKWGGYVHEFF